MTPHEKALKVAHTDEACLISEKGIEDAIQTYLTTLLDSPEMVESLNMAIHRGMGFFGDESYEGVKPAVLKVITAIKKEVGI